MAFKNGDPISRGGGLNSKTRPCPHCGGTQYDWGLGSYDEDAFERAGPQPPETTALEWRCRGGCEVADVQYVTYEELYVIRRPTEAEILAIPDPKYRALRAAIHGYANVSTTYPNA